MKYNIDKMAIASKTVVDKAGVVLATSTERTKEYVEALQVLAQWRLKHEGIIHSFQGQVKTWLCVQPWVEDSWKPVIAARIKRLPSIITKLQRFPRLKLSKVQDLVGIRVILPSISAVRKLESKALTHEGLARHQDYVARPKSSGYRGIHCIYQLGETQLELQIRTWRQHQWATAVESIGLALGLGDDIKTQQATKEWEDFFAMVSSVYARKEGMPSLYPEMSDADLRQAIIELEGKLQILNILNKNKSARVYDSMSWCNITWFGSGGDYHLVCSDHEEKTVKIYSYNSWNDINQYLHVGDHAEPFKKGPHQQDVALFMEGRHIQRAYPNYFMEVHPFIESTVKPMCFSRGI